MDCSKQRVGDTGWEYDAAYWCKTYILNSRSFFFNIFWSTQIQLPVQSYGNSMKPSSCDQSSDAMVHFHKIFKVEAFWFPRAWQLTNALHSSSNSSPCIQTIFIYLCPKCLPFTWDATDLFDVRQPYREGLRLVGQLPLEVSEAWCNSPGCES